MKTSKVFNTILHSLFPCRCPYCGKIIRIGEYACKSCADNIRQENIVSKLSNCVNVSPFRLDGMYRQAVYSLKFSTKPGYAEQMAVPMIIALKSVYGQQLKEIDYVTFVPATQKSENKRGYNQSKLLAKHIGIQLEVCCKPLLIKVKENETQHLLPRNKRKSNVEKVFAHNKKYDISNKNILLVDDIFTTGSTVGECAKVLLGTSAQNVLCTTFVTVLPENIENAENKM